MKRRRKTSRVRDLFRFKFINEVTGERRPIVSPAMVKYGHQTIALVLTADPVRKSIKLDGVGDTTKCPMATCTVDHKHLFPHPIVGYIDWTYSRVFIASKLNPNGLPSECVAYEHGDAIAHLNDTKNGQQEVLKRIMRDGPITMLLKPYRKPSERGRCG